MDFEKSLEVESSVAQSLILLVTNQKQFSCYNGYLTYGIQNQSDNRDRIQKLIEFLGSL